MININGYTKPKEIRIKEGFMDAGKRGLCYGYINLDQCWGIVQWNGEDDPDLHKMIGLEEKLEIWSTIK